MAAGSAATASTLAIGRGSHHRAGGYDHHGLSDRLNATGGGVVLYICIFNMSIVTTSESTDLRWCAETRQLGRTRGRRAAVQAERYDDTPA